MNRTPSHRPLETRLVVVAVAIAAAWPGARAAGGTDQHPPATQPAAEQPQTTRRHQRPPPVRRVIGLVSAWERLGRDLPIGRDIAMGHVEGTIGQYMPNWRTNQFVGVVFAPRSGQSEPFAHATATAKIIYGANGLAPGVRVVHCFTSESWMRSAYLKLGTAEPPQNSPLRVINHSWIGTVGGGPAGNARVLRRIDYQIDQIDVVMCVGVNNKRETAVPVLLSSAYNVIAVGNANGNSSGGFTRAEGSGRCKPEIVAPKNLTSFSTPIVSACVARLLEAADQMPGSGAARAESIKAVLLAGASKPAEWAPLPGKPLDEHLGAGAVNLDKSLAVLAWPAAPGRLLKRYGWDFNGLAPGERRNYCFDLARPLGEASIVLTWHRRIAGHTAVNARGRRVWTGVPRMADLDLHLIRIDDLGQPGELSASQSPIDNVEHVYARTLEPGRYRIEVRRKDDGHDEQWDFALAWRIELSEA